MARTIARPRTSRAPRSRVATAWARLRETPRELVLLLAVAGVLATSWAVVLVPFQGPDEITHTNYVLQIAETGKGPGGGVTGGYQVSTELGQALDWMNLRPTIGASDARPAQTEVEERVWQDELQPNVRDELRKDGTGPSPLANNPPLYYAYEAVPYLVFGGADLFDRIMAMRLANGALFVLTVLLTWLLATEIFGRERRLEVTLATAVVALWPMLTFMAGSVNPDTGTVTGYTLVALLAVRLVKRGPALGRVVALMLACAATLLVHGRGSASALVVLAALLVAWVRFRPSWTKMLGWSAAGAGLALLPLLLSRVMRPEGSGGGLYGSEAEARGAFNLRGLVSQTWQFYFDRLSFMAPRLGPDYGYRQVVVERWVVGVFGGLEITYPTWVYDVAQYAIVLFVIAAWTAAVVHRDRVLRAWPVLVVLGTLAAGLLLLLHAASYRSLLTSPDPLVTGRYLLPLTPLVAVALAWFAGVLGRRTRPLFAGGVLVALLLLQFAALGMTVVRFHA